MDNDTTLSKELIIRGIKMIDIAYLTILYLLLSITFSVILDKMIGEFDPKEADKKTTFRLFMEIFGTVAIIGILAYFIRNMVERFPFPLNGIGGFQHSKVKELAGGTVFGFAIFLYQNNLRAKISYVIDNRIFKKKWKLISM